MKKISIFLIGLALFIHAPAFSSENRIRIGIQSGPFMPQDWQIQGSSYLYYDPGGQSIGGSIQGFGNGADLAIFGDYFIGNWGLRLEGGARLLQNRKLKYTNSYETRTFENKLTVIPLTLSLLHNVPWTYERFSPYFGLGGGIYFAEWEEKETFSYLGSYDRLWIKGSETPLGVHFMAGLNYRIWQGVIGGFEYRYSFVEAAWELKNEDSQAILKKSRVNIGGVSLGVSVAYEF